jgi:hypothetical protein
LERAFVHGDLESLFEGKPILDLRTNIGVTRLLSKSRYLPVIQTLEMLPSTSFGCALSWLMRPLGLSEGHTRQTLEKVLDPSTLVISIHLRTGARSNDVFNQKPSKRGKAAVEHYQPWWDCAEGVERLLHKLHGSEKEVVWLFYSDSIAVRRAVRKRFGDKKVLTCASDDCVPEHTRGALLGAKSFRIENATSTVKGLQQAVSEQSLMSLGDAFLLSESSGFGRNSAVLRNARIGERPVFILHPRNPADIGACDDPERAVNFTSLANIPGYL